jgi:hypothetical protein
MRCWRCWKTASPVESQAQQAPGEFAMTVRGKVKNGKVMLEKPLALPDGTEVEIRRAKKRKTRQKKAKPGKPKSVLRSLADRLRNVIGKAKNLPTDGSVNHDYYLYGLPKEE